MFSNQYSDEGDLNSQDHPETPKENLLEDESEYLKLSEFNDLYYTQDNEKDLDSHSSDHIKIGENSRRESVPVNLSAHLVDDTLLK